MMNIRQMLLNETIIVLHIIFLIFFIGGAS